MIQLIGDLARNRIAFLIMFYLSEVWATWLYLRSARVSPFYALIPLAGHLAMFREMLRMKPRKINDYEYARWWFFPWGPLPSRQ